MAHAASSVCWTEVAKANAERPDLPRSGHASATLPEEHEADVIIFGGYTETAAKERHASSDIWVFTASSASWSRLVTTGGPPRARLVAQTVRVGWELYVIGGWALDAGSSGDGTEILSDVWVLDLKTAAWRQIIPQGERLGPISRFQALAVGSDIYLHTHRNTDSILKLSTASAAADGGPRLSLLQVQTPDGAPPSRGLHTLTAVGSSLYLFGGAPKSGPMMGDLWQLDLAATELSWRQRAPRGRAPHARCSLTAVAVNDHTIAFHGGSYYKEDGSGLQPLDDMFVLDTAANEWRWPDEIAGGAKPSPRNAHTAELIGGDKILLHGGWSPFVESYNDTWLLQLVD